MRLSLLIPTAALFSSALGAAVEQTRSLPVQPISPRLHGLDKRQFATLNLCATIPLGTSLIIDPTDLGLLAALGPQEVNLNENLCLCVDDGLLTGTSLDTLELSLINNSGLSAVLLGLDTNVLVPVVAAALVNILGTSQPTTPRCEYPAGAIPTSCTTCDFDCDAAAGFIKCGTTCFAGAVCPSALVGGSRRRELPRGQAANLLCPAEMTACALPVAASTKWARNFECLDTTKNVDTCGGCEFPLPDQPKGVDCTIIPNTESVSCVAGKCVVHGCAEGFVLVESACVAV
ncbi:uncharacterized protein MKK02DRAFT_34011 [Dioszegia hungarica]|uniref:Protein CPL1-like domain-containing protein n=1 Tax=Dioszegia hungarica TaxID=4972 RepID=A0AA38H992_9TREE|nr:uncharacterized protein MKK02DRAFT_34011 [Dioszegia hungarica]KAI9636932.1 hypothetical protein MKK02DRAFT_34011 [Dioszegia hungarica]